MIPRAPSRDRTINTYSDRGRASDCSSALVVALVLSIAVLLAAIAITIFDNT
jgi:hypothetical protein